MFKATAALEDFFGCRLQFVDQALIHIQKTYGSKEWMRGRPTIERLPGYDAETRGNHNFLIMTRADAEWKTVYWLCENGIDGWSHERVLERSSFTYYFYFRDPGDWALARLAS